MSRLSQGTLVSCQFKKNGCRGGKKRTWKIVKWSAGEDKKDRAFIASIAAGSGATVSLDGIRSHIGDVENGFLNGLLE